MNAAVVNDGTIVVSSSPTLPGSTGGELTIEDAVSGSGAITLAAGASLQIDNTLGSSQIINFTSGAPETLILQTPLAGLSNPIDNIQQGDKIDFGGGMTIDSVAMNGTVLTLSFNGATGQPSTYSSATSMLPRLRAVPASSPARTPPPA